MRNYKKHGNQTRPEKAGEQNMGNYSEKHAGTGDGLMGALSELFRKSVTESQKRQGNWKPEELADALDEFFNWCAEHDVKPAKAGVKLWLGCSDSQYSDWQRDEARYGAISALIQQANRVMEMQYVSRGEKYPTMNTFLLKTSHGHIETSKLDVSTNGNAPTTEDDVKDLVSKMGLDKKKE